MLTLNATVTEVQGDRAWVVGQRPGCCDGDTSCACGVLGRRNARREVMALNQARARRGDIVELAIGGSNFIWAAAAVYGLPALFLLFGGLVGHSLGATMSGFSNLAPLTGGAAGFALGALVSWTLNKRAERTGRTIPVVTRVLVRHPRPEPDRF